MSMRQEVGARGGVALAVAAVLTLTLAGCGGEGSDDKSKGTPDSPSRQAQAGTQTPTSGNGQSEAPTEVIATANGASGMILTINSARRDQGGFVTVNGQIKNTGSQSYKDTATWRGIELKGTGESVAGATLVDKVGKKRYYVLRDTESRCLCTTGVSSVDPGEVVPFFAQFPAPPASTTEVEFSLPTFATATVKISG